MTTKEYFVEAIKDESPRFERVFQALEGISQEKMQYKPDPKSRTAMELVQTIAGESGMFVEILEKGELDFAKFPFPKLDSVAAASAHFKKEMEKLGDVASKMGEADWASQAAMGMNGKLDWKTERGKAVFSFLFDLVHHRGQLSAYIRAVGGTVPSIYGPSADAGM